MRIAVRVVTNSGKQEVTKISPDEYKVFLKRSPENNKANEELVKMLSKHFKRKVTILRGKTSRNKIIEIKENGN